jgi:hypothetical protein
MKGVKKMAEWISVKDRLPEEGANVLIYNKEYLHKGLIETDYYENNRFRYFRDTVTHWMPLPSPPNAEE